MNFVRVVVAMRGGKMQIKVHVCVLEITLRVVGGK